MGCVETGKPVELMTSVHQRPEASEAACGLGKEKHAVY